MEKLYTVNKNIPGDPTVKTEGSTTREQKPGSCHPQTPPFHLHPQVSSAQLQALQPPWPLHIQC